MASKDITLRQAYFNGDLTTYFNAVMADHQVTVEEAAQIEAELTTLRDEEVRAVKTFGLQGNQRPPSVDELEAAVDLEWYNEWMNSVTIAKKTIRDIRLNFNQAITTKKQVSKDDWLDWALQIETLKRWLVEEVIFLEQLYRRELTRLIDAYGMSRAEAGERAKLTRQYRDYANAKAEVDSLTEIVLLCKKRASIDL